jgi:dephospho-CoA kinase
MLYHTCASNTSRFGELPGSTLRSELCYYSRMSLIYVTGISGSGKTAVCEELARRGFEAHEADNTLNAFYHNETGEKLTGFIPVALRTPEWRKQHTWKMSKDKLLELKDNSGDRPVFVCGVAANENDCLDVFDKVFALTIDEATLLHRITTRTNSDFGKAEGEMELLVEWQQTAEEDYRKIGAHIIDATKPLPEVANEILDSVKTE